MAWVVGLVALLILAVPFAAAGSLLGTDDDGPDADLAAVRLADADDDGADDEREVSDRDDSVRETADGNTLRNGDNSITANTKIGDTTERPTHDANTQRDGDNSITGNTRGADTTQDRAAAPAAQGFAPAYGPAGDSVSGASASG